MKRMSKKALMIFSIVMASIMIISATYAWYVSNDVKENRIKTAQITDGSVEIFEVFDPKPLIPGGKLDKKVGVVNNGEASVLARLSFEEVLKLLKNNGAPTQVAAAGLGAVDPTWIPVNFNADAYTTWTTVNPANVVGGIPAGLVIKQQTTVDISDPTRLIHNFVIYRPLTGVNQKVTADFSVTGTQITMSNLQYWFFEGYNTVEKDWAGQNIVVTPGTPITSPLAPVSNWTAKTGPLVSDANITIYYDQVTQTMTANNWYYNEPDGYFYYMGAIAPGTISPLLMSAVGLSGTADGKYALMDLNLAVTLEAIQNTSDAIQSPTGWNLNNTSALYLQLATYCAY